MSVTSTSFTTILDSLKISIFIFIDLWEFGPITSVWIAEWIMSCVCVRDHIAASLKTINRNTCFPCIPSFKFLYSKNIYCALTHTKNQWTGKDIHLMVGVTDSMYIYKELGKVISCSIKCSKEIGITGCDCGKPQIYSGCLRAGGIKESCWFYYGLCKIISVKG